MPTVQIHGSAVAQLCFRLWRVCRQHRHDIDHALVVVFWDARYINHARGCLTLTNFCALNSRFRHSAPDARR